MAKRVFFSFHYQDVIDLRANVVRNHWVTKPDREAAGFFDASLWESVKRTGSFALIERPWVRYEILRSFKRGNLLLGVHINSIKGRDQRIKLNGPNPFEFVGVTFAENGRVATLWEKVNNEWREYSEVDGCSSYPVDVTAQYRGKGFNFANWYSTHDWTLNNGYSNFATWVGC
jgi:hypothetical protein